MTTSLSLIEFFFNPHTTFKTNWSSVGWLKRSRWLWWLWGHPGVKIKGQVEVKGQVKVKCQVKGQVKVKGQVEVKGYPRSGFTCRSGVIRRWGVSHGVNRSLWLTAHLTGYLPQAPQPGSMQTPKTKVYDPKDSLSHPTLWSVYPRESQSWNPIGRLLVLWNRKNVKY